MTTNLETPGNMLILGLLRGMDYQDPTYGISSLGCQWSFVRPPCTCHSFTCDTFDTREFEARICRGKHAAGGWLGRGKLSLCPIASAKAAKVSQICTVHGRCSSGFSATQAVRSRVSRGQAAAHASFAGCGATASHAIGTCIARHEVGEVLLQGRYDLPEDLATVGGGGGGR